MATQRKRNPNGAGTITKRKDGRYQAAVYVLQPDGTRARKFAYGKTWAECDTKRRELLAKVDQGVPVPTRSAKLSEWLPYWLENIIKPRRKRTTYAKYETHIRLYLAPMLGSKRLESLSVADVRRFLVRLEQQTTAATAKESHRVLRTALTAACREELVMRNVATLVEPPSATPGICRPGRSTRPCPFSPPAGRTRFTRRSSSPSRSASAVGRSWAFGGRTWTSTSERSGSALSGNVSAVRPTRTIPRGAAGSRRSPCPPFALPRSDGNGCGRRPCAKLPVISGRRPATSSPPAPAGRSSPATCTARSPVSQGRPGFA